MIKAIFLDMDDTLIVNQVLYKHAEYSLRGYMRHFGVLPHEVDEVFARIDKELFKTHGVSQTRMPASFEAVLKHFVPDADAEMIDIVRDLAKEIFTTVAAIKPGTLEAMEMMTAKYPVYIVTSGDKDVQERRLSHLPFKGDLSGFFAVGRKDKDVFKSLLKHLNLKADEVVMMGDSLKSDVVPAVDAGMHAVWVEAHNSPLHETVKSFPEKRARKFSSLVEAATHIVKYGELRQPVQKSMPALKKKPKTPKP